MWNKQARRLLSDARSKESASHRSLEVELKRVHALERMRLADLNELQELEARLQAATQENYWLRDTLGRERIARSAQGAGGGGGQGGAYAALGGLPAPGGSGATPARASPGRSGGAGGGGGSAVAASAPGPSDSFYASTSSLPPGAAAAAAGHGLPPAAAAYYVGGGASRAAQGQPSALDSSAASAIYDRGSAGSSLQAPPGQYGGYLRESTRDSMGELSAAASAALRRAGFE